MKWIGIVLGGLVGLVALAAGVLFLLGRRANAGRLMGSIEIARPPEVVFSWLVEPAKLMQWISWLEEIKQDTPGPQAVGTRQRWMMNDPNMKQMLAIPFETTAFDANRRIVVRVALPDGFTGESAWTLTDLGGGRTRFDSDARFVYTHPFAKLMEPIITAQATKKLADDMARLKAKAEAG